jgi:hypothetical protein
MIKLIYLLWPREAMEPATRRTTLLEGCAPRLIESGARYLLMNIDDDLVSVADADHQAQQPVRRRGQHLGRRHG